VNYNEFAAQRETRENDKMTADKMASKHAFSVNGNTRSTRTTGKDSVLVDRKSLRPED